MKHAIPLGKIEQIKQLAAAGGSTKDIARHVGLSPSTVHKVRVGAYDERVRRAVSEDTDPAQPIEWCPRCRCHVYPPCRLCQLRASGRWAMTRRRASLPAGIDDPRVLDRLRMNVAEIGLPLRVVNNLQQWNLLTVNDLLHTTRAELLRLPNFAERTLEQIHQCLERLGFVRRGRKQRKKRQRGLRKAG